MPKRKSFLEKLTGSIEIEKEEPAVRRLSPREEIKLEKVKKQKKAKSADLSAETKVKAGAEQREEDWLPEQEGQLTVDVYQTEQDIVIKSTIAGVEPQTLDIAITNDMVTIKGVREKDEEVSEEDYYCQECYWGPFSRSIILPLDVDTDKTSAMMKNGILTVRLPKVEKSKTKKIRVKMA